MTDFTHHTPRLLSDADAAADLAGVARPNDLPSVGTEDARAMATYTLTIVADSGYEATTEGRCSAVQYSAAVFVLHNEGVDLVALTEERDELASRVRELEGALRYAQRLLGGNAPQCALEAIDAALASKEQP